MNWNSGVSANNNSETLNKNNDAFNFHTPGHESDNDSYQTIDEDEYSDDDDDDDEYEPIEMAAWGDSAKTISEPASWNNLIDPSIKVKAGGVGSGNLHRRGGNFKPVSEDFIIAQRLKKGVSTKKPGSKSRGGKKKKKASSAANAPPIRPPVRPTVVPRRVVAVPRVPERQRSANAPSSPWGAAPLVETPFWEVKKEPEISNSQPLAYNPPVTPLPSQHTTDVSSRTIASVTTSINATIKKTPPTTSPSASSSVTTTTTTTTTTSTKNIPKWNPNAEGFTPLSKKPASPSWNASATTFNPNIPSFTPSPTLAHTPTTVTSSNSSSTLTSSSPAAKTVFNTNVAEFLSFVQLPVKKSIKITAPTDTPASAVKATPAPPKEIAPKESVPKANMMASLLLRKQLQTINNGLSRSQPSVTKVTTTTATTTGQHLNLESQTGPESTRGLEEPKPLVQINMELAPGISTEILVYENSDPEQLAEEFGIKHHLNVTNTAKANIARTIHHLLTTKKAALGL